MNERSSEKIFAETLAQNLRAEIKQTCPLDSYECQLSECTVSTIIDPEDLGLLHTMPIITCDVSICPIIYDEISDPTERAFQKTIDELDLDVDYTYRPLE